MESEGMVAVVRGLRDSGLAVTLLDGSHQYTLMPNAGQNCSKQQVHMPHCNPHATHGPPQAAQPVVPPKMSVHPTSPCPQPKSSGMGDQPVFCDNASQATDGRYASMYKMSHCKVTPTSPPVQLTEFPPQRAALCPGYGNFEVGGSGSGENYVPCRSNGSFRGGMSWPDRGSVCSPRPSREPDAFANSLRKYPNLSMERSTEMVERLITYTQAKNLSKSYQSRYPSPTRPGIDQQSSDQLVLDRSQSRNTPRSSSYLKSYEDVNVSTPKTKPRLEESPTRDLRSNDCEYADYRRVSNSTKKTKENIRSLSYTVPYHQPVVSAGVRERYDHSIMTGHKTPSMLTATNSVNMEVQVATEMVSREVATVPRPETFKRTVAVPLSPTTSGGHLRGDVSNQHALPTHRSVETASMPVDLSVQTASNTDISKPVKCQCIIVERKTKSEEKLNVDKQLSDEIMELLDRVSVCPNADPRAVDLRREVLKQMSNKLQKMSENIGVSETDEKDKERIANMLKYVPVWVPCGDAKSYREAVSDKIINKINDYKACHVYRAETQVRMQTKDSKLEDFLYKVISSLPIKTMDVFGKPVEKNRIVETYVKQIKRFIKNISNTDMDILKAEILVLISKIPIAISTYNKVDYLNRIIDSLMAKLRSFYFNTQDDDKITNPGKIKRFIQPTDEEIRKHILNELNIFLKKSNLNIANVKEIEADIADILIDSFQDLQTGKVDNLANEIILLLLRETDNMTESQATIFTERMLENFIKKINCNSTVDKNNVQIANQFRFLQNLSKSSQEKINLHKSSDLNTDIISKEDANANDVYMTHLTQQIDEWLENLNTNMPQMREPGLREVVVNDLAGDIVDRQKYLGLNPLSKGTDDDELEQLKYQIFKWINKLAGEDNLETIEKAPELMQRIQSIPIHTLSTYQKTWNCVTKYNCNNNNFKTNPNASTEDNSNILVYANKSNVRLSQINQSLTNKTNNDAQPCCSGTTFKPMSPTTKKLNAEYDAFLKKWVEEIPIPTKTPKEKLLADKARMGIYNGIWKAITKLKFEPATFHNPFYYEDALDDEIEELFSSLPKSPELETKKYLLKVQLIEKTTNTNELIKATVEPASFKEQLVNSVLKSLPQNYGPENSVDSMHPYELQVRKLVENYILCTKYREEDRNKANIYRKKLVKQVQTLIDHVKKTHGKELKDIDPDLYANSILNALQKVPLPDEETIRDEANEILLGQEVEQWFSDLPLIQEDNGTEQLYRKILKDELVKKVHDIEKEVNILDCTGEKAVRDEVAQFLQKVPLEDGEIENISFMAEEFANRIKNRSRQEHSNERRKSVSFMDSAGYYEFSQHIPQCSSFSKLTGTRPAVRDQSSYMIRGGSIVKDDNEYGHRPLMNQFEQSYKQVPSDQFFTMEDSQAPKQESRPKMEVQPQIQNENWHVPRAPSNMGSPERQQSPCCRNATNDRRSSVISQSRMPSVEWQSIPIATNSDIPSSPERQPSPCCRSPISQRQSLSRDKEPRYIPSGNINNVQEVKSQSYQMNQQANEIYNRADSPSRRRPSTSMQYIDPNDGQCYKADERSVNQSFKEIGNIPRDTRVADNQGLPSSISYGEPQGFSTPQQGIREMSPQRPGRKRGRNGQKNRRDFARRRLDLDDDTDFESEEEQCRCLERMYRSRRRPICYAYDECEIDDACYPIPYSYPCFY